jgi:SAM-dependent methyltransferase
VDAAALRQRLDALAAEHGPWQDNLLVRDGVYTVTEVVTRDQSRVAAIVQGAADALAAPLEGARVLDLGGAEGRFAVELARHGADVTMVEGRAGNVEKVRFLKEVLDLANLDVVQDDVRNLSRERYGEFDLVLCLGVLYHLDAPAAVALAHRIAEVTRRVAIVDTHVSLTPVTSVTIEGRAYLGRRVREFDPGASEEERERLSRSALTNAESLWFTDASLLNLLADAGFTSVADLVAPYHRRSTDRRTFVAFRGASMRSRSAPGLDSGAATRRPEKERATPHPNQTAVAAVKLRLAPLAPALLKEWARRQRERGGGRT